MEKSSYPRLPVMLIDDETQFLKSGSFSLKTSGINNVRTCHDSRDALQQLAEEPCSAVVLDIMMPHLTGKELLPQIVREFPGVPVIMLTALNEVETAVECMKLGAFDYMVKPIDKTRLVTTVKRAVDFNEIKNENSRLKEYLLSDKLDNPASFEHIVTRNHAMHQIFQYIEAVAQTSLPILVTAETGCGKELIARAIHNASGRTGEFVPVNVAGLDDNLFSDTLFGHMKGAFTGADRERAGLVGKASDGTLFLDEIGDLAVESQVKLLRLLEEKKYYRIGSDSATLSSARIVVATNRDLGKSMADGTFRSDLYYRLNTHHIVIPALRKRKDDMELLVGFFLEESADEFGKTNPTPPPELFTLLSTYHFPGNIRELKGMVYDAVSRHRGGVLSTETFRNRIRNNDVQPGIVPNEPDMDQGSFFFPEQLPTIKELEKSLIEEALHRAKNNQTVAAQLLGLTRSALNKRLNRPAKN